MALRMTTGISGFACFIARQMSRPDMPGKHEVEHHGIQTRRRELLQTLFAVVGAADLISLGGKQPLQRLEDARVVFDCQYRAHDFVCL